MGRRVAGADDFHADEEQLAEIQGYAAQYGRASGTEVRVVVLPPELDTKGNWPLSRRPSLRAAIEGIERGEYDALAVAYLKRLTRSRSGYEIWERVERGGGRVHCARERIDTSTAYGRRMRDYAIADAVHEREEHAEQHAMRRKTTVQLGMWRQRQVPTGYRKGAKPDRRLFPDRSPGRVADTRAGDVRWAFRRAVARASLVEIADVLGMTPSGVRYLLRNRVYLGELREGGIAQDDGTISPVYENLEAHEPLIDVDLFERVQGVLADHVRPARRRGAEMALLAGLVVCCGCGHTMTRRPTQQDVYGCTVHHSGGRCPRPAAIVCHRLDPYVEAIALAELDRIKLTAHERGRGLARAEREAAEALAELEAYVESTSAAGLGGAVFAEGARRRQSAVDAANERLRAERARHATLPAPSTGAASWELLDMRERNALLRALLKGVLVQSAGRGKRVPVGDRVRVLAYGMDIRFATREGRPEAGAGIVAVPLPDHGLPGVLPPAAS